MRQKKTATTKHWATQNGSQIIHMILNEPPILSFDMLPTIRRLFRSMNECYDTYNWSDRFIEFNWLRIFHFDFCQAQFQRIHCRLHQNRIQNCTGTEWWTNGYTFFNDQMQENCSVLIRFPINCSGQNMQICLFFAF